MALHIKIKTQEDNNVHFDTCRNNYTLCGLETGGDTCLRISEGKRVKAPVDCPHCIQIVRYCKNIADSEIKESYQLNQ